jgi:hypothetical protein
MHGPCRKTAAENASQKQQKDSSRHMSSYGLSTQSHHMHQEQKVHIGEAAGDVRAVGGEGGFQAMHGLCSQLQHQERGSKKTVRWLQHEANT